MKWWVGFSPTWTFSTVETAQGFGN